MEIETEQRKIVFTTGITAKVAADESFTKFVMESLQQHWHHDRDGAIRIGDRLFSTYENSTDKILVTTERDESITTVLFPEEYQ